MLSIVRVYFVVVDFAFVLTKMMIWSQFTSICYRMHANTKISISYEAGQIYYKGTVERCLCLLALKKVNYENL